MYFKEKTIFSASGDLADGQRSPSFLTHVKHHRAEVLGCDRDLVVINRAKRFSSESLNRTLGPFAQFVESVQVGTKRSDAKTSDMRYQIAPMCANISKRARSSRFDTPVPIRIVEQPVLRIGSLDYIYVAKIARFRHAAHILYLRIEANVVQGAIRQTRFLRQRRHGYGFFSSRS